MQFRRTLTLCTVLPSLACQVAGRSISPAVGLDSRQAGLVDSTVAINGGKVVGKVRNNAGVLEFLGIPFAAPPVNNLRWKSPQAAPKISGSVNATTLSASCYAAEEGAPPVGPQSEHCLFLNVWTGARDTSEKRPVMIWVYGGGFQFGSASQPNYNGSNLALEDVVVVTFNYRLGVFGFLALPELDDEGTNSGNFGLQDQLAALKWVRDNIFRFGGDPDNVTIFGESAGAHSVGLLLSSKLSTGLFHKAILESGAYWDSEHGSLETFQDARSRGEQFKQKVGAGTLAQLRSLSAADVNTAAQWNSSTDPAITAFAPSIDNYVVPAAPPTVFANGQTVQVPILAGFNSDEEFLFLPRALPHNSTLEYQTSANVFFASQANRGLQLYPGGTEQEATQSANEMIGDLVIRQQTWEAVDRQASVSGQTCFAYYFTYTSAYSPKAAHTAEIDFVFGNLQPNPIFGQRTAHPSDEDAQMSKTMMKYWTNFAKTSNPNGDNVSDWPSYNSANGGKFLQLGNTITSIPTPDLDRFQFIESFRSNGDLPLRWRNEFFNN